MRLLIIVTAPSYPLWKATGRVGWQPADAPQDAGAKVRVVGPDVLMVFPQADVSNSYSETEREEENREQTTSWVVEAANAPQYAAAEKVYVAGHEGYVDAERVRADVGERLDVCTPFIHMKGKPPYDELLWLVTQPDADADDAYDAAVDAVKKKLELTHSQRLSTIKHRLAHLFLPVSVDLQAWRSFDFDNEHMNDMLNWYREDEGRMERARRLVYEHGQVAGAESVEKLVKELGLESSEAWGKVNRLLPRNEPTQSDDIQAAPFYVEVFVMKDVLGSLREKTGLNRLREALEAGDDSFNEWYIALETALVELRDVMEGGMQG